MKLKNSFKWIKNNNNQLEWLNYYLQARLSGFKTVCLDVADKKPNNELVATFIKQIKKLKTGDTLELFNIKARTAWNQHKRRLKRRNTHVTSSFEIKKNTYKDVINVATTHNIPITLAVEELLSKGCELAQEASNRDKKDKIIDSLRKEVTRKHNSKHAIFNDLPSKSISKEILVEAFSTEAYERHILELELLELAKSKSKAEASAAKENEVKRYNTFCKELNLLNLI